MSYDYCCKGVNSTYYTVVGRSKKIAGLYVGKDGSKLMDGEGTIFIRADLEEQQRRAGRGTTAFCTTMMARTTWSITRTTSRTKASPFFVFRR